MIALAEGLLSLRKFRKTGLWLQLEMLGAKLLRTLLLKEQKQCEFDEV